MAFFVLTVVGRDRPGLVRAVAEQVAGAGGNWLESRMARLAGQFAGIVLVDAPEASAGMLAERLRGLAPEGLDVTLLASHAVRVPPRRTMLVEVTGHDRPGIVREITQLLASRGLNIEEFESRVASASFSAEQMFHARARLAATDGTDLGTLRAALERLGNELMVDITLEEDGDAR